MDLRSSKDCLKTSKGENFQGKHNYVVIHQKLRHCQMWNLTNWHQLEVNERTVKGPGGVEDKLNFHTIDKSIKKWIKKEGRKSQNQCRNPGGVLP